MAPIATRLSGGHSLNSSCTKPSMRGATIRGVPAATWAACTRIWCCSASLHTPLQLIRRRLIMDYVDLIYQHPLWYAYLLGWSSFFKVWNFLAPPLELVWLHERLHRVQLFSNGLIFTRRSMASKFTSAQHRALAPKSGQTFSTVHESIPTFPLAKLYVIIMHNGCECVREEQRKKGLHLSTGNLHWKVNYGHLISFFSIFSFQQLFRRRWQLWCCSAQTHSYQSYIRKY